MLSNWRQTASDGSKAYSPAMIQPALEERCAQLRHVLQGTGRVALEYVDAPIWEPTAGSEGEAELNNVEVGPNGPWGDIPVRTAYAMANAGITAVLDQLTALDLLTQPVAPALAPTVVARSVVEIGCGVWWLMEPGIGARRRVARCGADEMNSALRAVQVANKLGGGPEVQEYLDGEARVRARLDGLGLAIIENRFEPSVGGEKAPDATTLTTDCLSQLLDHGSVVYNVYSAITHGTLYGLMQFFADSSSDPVRLEWTRPLQLIETTVQVALVACLLSVDRIIEVMGWDSTAWEDWKPEVGEAYP